jgi:dTDP-4-amino-4,6-dideoxygalactose transaminase
MKIVTTGKGGVTTTNQKALTEKIQLRRSHGVTRETHLMNKVLEGGWYYQQVIRIPVFHAMTIQDQDRVVEILERDLI